MAQGRPQARLICASLAHLIDGGELGRGGALEAIASEPFGPVLLILVALGLIAFGLLSFFEAKWRRTYGGVPV